MFVDALVEGRVSYAHGEVLASVANVRNRDALRDTQHMLIDIAVSYSFDEWAQIVRRLAVDLDSDGSYDPNEDPDANRLKVVDHPDGTAGVKAHLTGDAAVTVTQCVERIADELFHRYQRDAQVDPALLVPSRARLMAEALVEACRRAMAVDLGSTQKPGVEATIIIGSDPDADLLDDLKNAGESGAATGKGFNEDEPGSNFRCRDSKGRVIPASAAEILLVDPVVRGLLLNGDGVPLYLGDKVRFVIPDQKAALAVRDGGCIFPGMRHAPGVVRRTPPTWLGPRW